MGVQAIFGQTPPPPPPPPTCKDLMKVHNSVRIPSPLLSSLTNRITRNRRKKVMDTRELSSPL